ncbi:resuscitation-promoting factor [Pseudactinotalea sp. HY160]|uniref:resuscitation-promoting factor n=1 Tax=Pseudactinotalea sp. HY160 TaxID=2654490 RepID=UPI001D14DF2E|nr:resuscitation-promoting factor [Pseudactinotalea sp. HY160]
MTEPLPVVPADSAADAPGVHGAPDTTGGPDAQATPAPRRRLAIALLAGGLTLLLAVGGITAASAHKRVSVDLDGTIQSVGTFAGSVAGALEVAGISPGDHDLVVPGPGESLEDGAEIVVRTAEQVSFVVDGEPTELWTIGRTAAEALSDVASSGRTVTMATSRSGDGRPDLDLPLVTDDDVDFAVDGEERTVAMTGTVGLARALEQAGITLGELDAVAVSIGAGGTPLVTVTRISEDEKKTTETVDFTTETRKTGDRYQGESVVVQAGKEGVRTIVTWQRTVDGEVVKEEVRSDEVTTEPVTKIVEVGTKARPAPKPAPARSSSGSGGGSAPAGVWAKLAQCESGGNPGAVSASGTYHGLYQFSVATWNAVGGSGLPSQASAAEQTKRAKILQARSGWGQWPACSSKLGLR